MKKVLTEIHDAGYLGKTVFLAGHGIGGEVVAVYGSDPSKYVHLDGVLLFSSYLPTEFTLTTYPFPVLTISGDLDGLTRTTRIVDSFAQLQDSLESDSTNKYTTPVIVMEGVNHRLFIDGKVPSSMTNYDLNPEISQETALDAVANFTNAFMTYVKNDTRNDTGSDDVMAAEALLDEGYKNTSAALGGMLTIKGLDQNQDYISHWTNTAQQLVISIKDPSSVEFVNYEDEALQERKKTRDLDTENTKIESFTTLYIPHITKEQTGQPLSPLELKAAMTSQAAVKEMFPNATFGKVATCKDINQAAFSVAFSKSSPKAKSRYTVRGKPIQFIDDYVTTSQFKWQASFIVMTYNNTGLFVKSTRYESDREVTPNFNGEYACTLLSPLRAMEWINIDSLKSLSNKT